MFANKICNTKDFTEHFPKTEGVLFLEKCVKASFKPPIYKVQRQRDKASCFHGRIVIIGGDVVLFVVEVVYG